MIRKSFACLAVLGALTLGSCGSSSKNAAEYNNSIITVINENESHIANMNSAMTSADYAKAETVRAEWEKALTADIKKVEDLGDFNGDGEFQKAVVDGLKGYQKIVTDAYPKLIEIRKNNVEDPATETKLLDDINKAFEDAANNVNKASDAFEAKYNK
ncbi:hypothetical protein [Sphingobacterium sp.]|uniref:LIC11966 family surface protein n=1 Tax=Sphingobacterium sp. TaxID=341027 RepID=UPI0028B09A7D|nr:hypothetical protein [Sphingobacterium sp.]